MYNHKAYLQNEAKRQERKENPQSLDTPLRDIRLYFTYQVPNTFFYLFNFTRVILRTLAQKNFLCPGYSHICISIGDTREAAIARAYEIEDWYRFGIAVLPENKLLQCPGEQLEDLVLNTIAEGLRDIATLDRLDIESINDAIALAKQWGILHERILKEKQNKKFCFRVSSLPIKGDPEEEIFFTLIYRDAQKEYKWKFGKLHLLDVGCWFFKLSVTNKLVRTRPAARTDMILKGKKKELEFSIEKIKNREGMLTLDDVKVPIPDWIIELEKKAGL